MIGKCLRCGKERHIYNPKQERKLCMSCYNYEHRDKKKQNERSKEWQKNNLEYFRKYYHKKTKIKRLLKGSRLTLLEVGEKE
jgi:hypothetical protein